ncbi:MAG: TspO/MBR family protein [Alphaproteobacteria bacterium]
MQKYRALAGFLLLVFAISGISSLITMPAVQGWYTTINKPQWTPPDWVFGPVWTTLYIMIAFSGWRVWRAIPSDYVSFKLRAPVLRAYWLQLLLNFLWTPAFFGLQSPVSGAIVITLLLAVILWNITAFDKADKPASWLLIPYALWVSYALSLNHAIVRLN